MSILVITTGGTIGALPYDDPRSPPKVSTMPENGKDYVRETLTGADFNFVTTRCISLEPRDSKLIDAKYQENIADLVAQAPEHEILITYGTDRILEQAKYFYRRLKTNSRLNGKVLLLTGAMTPLANGSGSDGFLNLDFSLKQLMRFAEHRSTTGVYVVLCDYNASGAWEPQLYLYQPGKYEKTYDSKDGTRNRIRQKI